MEGLVILPLLEEVLEIGEHDVENDPRCRDVSVLTDQQCVGEHLLAGHIRQGPVCGVWVYIDTVLVNIAITQLVFIRTRTSARYARIVLAPAVSWGSVQTLLGANKYSCIFIPTLSYPYIPIITHNTTPQYGATNLQSTLIIYVVVNSLSSEFQPDSSSNG